MEYKIYTAWGDEVIAKGIRPVKNNAGTGYKVIVDYKGQDVNLFYKTEEIATIMPIEKGA